MNLTPTELNGMYLGLSPTSCYKGITIRPLEVKEILACAREAKELHPMNELQSDFYEKFKIAYLAIDMKASFDEFLLKVDESDVDDILRMHENLLRKCPKIDLISEELLGELKEYFKNHSMQRFKWNLCKEYSKPPNELFGTGDYISDIQQLWIFVMQSIDADEKRTHYCDECWEKMTDPNLCHNCGKVIGGGDTFTSTTLSDDEWNRRAYGTFNPITGVWELPEETVQITEADSKHDYDNQVELSDEKYIEPIITEDVDDDGFIEMGEETPEDFDDFNFEFDEDEEEGE